MKIINILNFVLISIAIIYGVFDGINYLLENDIYSALIRLAIVPVMLLPFIIDKLFRFKISNAIIFLYVIFIFASHFLGSIVNLYKTIDNYDKFTHLLSGSMTALLGIVLLVKFKNYNKNRLVFNIIYILGIVSLIAILWEVFEFSFDNLCNKDAQNALTTGVADTMKDMISALIGSILIIVLYVYESISKTCLIINSFVKEIEKN